MGGFTNKTFAIILVVLLGAQVLFGLWHVGHPFVDGRHHYNWGPPFWLGQAEKIDSSGGLLETYGGLESYSSHPQLIAPVISIWTDLFGYSEVSIRMLALLLTTLATLILTLGIRSFLGNRRALIFLLFFASLPMIYIYGKKLDQETLLIIFLGLHLWGLGLLENSKRAGFLLVGIGSLGMMLSDWSGAVLALATGVGALVAWGVRNDNRLRTLMFLAVSWGASALGLVIFLAQSYLQSADSGISGLVYRYQALWEYRAGIADNDFTWLAWLKKQIRYASINFTAPIFLLGISGLVVRARKRIEESRAEWSCAVFSSAVFLGSLAYMLVVPQASAVHIYYQYYLAVPIALGLVFVVDLVTKRFFQKRKKIAQLFFVVIILVITVGASMYRYNKLLFVDSYGDVSDVELLKEIKRLPENELVITVNNQAYALEWFSNPNIVYYTGRAIQGYMLGGDIPVADWFLLPNGIMQGLVSSLSGDSRYDTVGSKIEATCASNLCLVRLVRP